MVLCCRAVEHNVATFSEFSLAVHWQGDYAKTMVDNLAEKIDKFRVIMYCLCTIGSAKSVRYRK